MNQASNRTLAATGQLQATAAQLQSDNQQIKAEISKIIREITSTSLMIGKQSPSPEWCETLTSEVETGILQSSYNELFDRHLKSSCEITTDTFTQMIRAHTVLWRRYKQTLRSHAVLADDLHRLTSQLMTPLGVRISISLSAIVTNLKVITAQCCTFFHYA